MSTIIADDGTKWGPSKPLNAPLKGADGSVWVSRGDTKNTDPIDQYLNTQVQPTYDVSGYGAGVPGVKELGSKALANLPGSFLNAAKANEIDASEILNKTGIGGLEYIASALHGLGLDNAASKLDQISASATQSIQAGDKRAAQLEAQARSGNPTAAYIGNLVSGMGTGIVTPIRSGANTYTNMVNRGVSPLLATPASVAEATAQVFPYVLGFGAEGNSLKAGLKVAGASEASQGLHAALNKQPMPGLKQSAESAAPVLGLSLISAFLHHALSPKEAALPASGATDTPTVEAPNQLPPPQKQLPPPPLKLGAPPALKVNAMGDVFVPRGYDNTIPVTPMSRGEVKAAQDFAQRMQPQIIPQESTRQLPPPEPRAIPVNSSGRAVGPGQADLLPPASAIQHPGFPVEPKKPVQVPHEPVATTSVEKATPVPEAPAEPQSAVQEALGKQESGAIGGAQSSLNEFSAKSTGNTVDNIRTTLSDNSHVKKAMDSGVVRVVGNEFDLPQSVQNSQLEKGNFGKVGGFWDGKHIWMIADNIPKGTEKGVLLHEGLHAIQSEMRKSTYKDMMGNRFDDLTKDYKRLLDSGDELAQKAEKRALKSGETGDRLHAERQAYLVSEWVKSGKPGGKAADLVRKIVSHLKAWVFKSKAYQALKRAGIPFHMKPEDFAALAEQGLKNLKDTGAEQSPLFSRRTDAIKSGNSQPTGEVGASGPNEQLPMEFKDVRRLGIENLGKFTTLNAEKALRMSGKLASVDEAISRRYYKEAQKSGMDLKMERKFMDYDEQKLLAPKDRTIKLSEKEKHIYEKYILPFRKAMHYKEGHVPREAAGYGGAMERLVTGAKKTARIGKLRVAMPSMKGRSMFALEDSSGNRIIVHSHKEGRNIYEISEYKNGKWQKIGRAKRTTADQETEKTLAPIDDEIRKLRVEKSHLMRNKGTERAAKVRISNINDALARLNQERRLTLSESSRLTGIKWKMNGKIYSIKDATAREIEKNTPVRYHNAYMAKLATEWVGYRQIERQGQFIENLKNDPKFLDTIATKDLVSAPKSWEPVDWPQFHGYVFEPRTAEVLNHYAKIVKNKPALPVLRGLNVLTRRMMFSIPIANLWHVKNVANIWQHYYGLSSIVNPNHYVRFSKTIWPAMKDATMISDFYLEALKHDAPLAKLRGRPLLSPEDMEKSVNSIGKLMDEDVEMAPLKRALGWKNVTHKLNELLKSSEDMVWWAQDVFTMQAIRNEMEKKGVTLDTAVNRVRKNMLTYELPEGSKTLNFVTSPDVTWFARYHLNNYKIWGQTIADAIGKDRTIKDRAKALDRLAFGAFWAFVVYPYVLDKGLQAVSGNPKAHWTRFGLSAIPYDVMKVVNGKESMVHLGVKQFTPAPGSYEALQQLFNTDVWSKSPIAPYYDTRTQSAADRFKHLAGMNFPLQNYIDAQSPFSGLASMLGAHLPPTEGQKISKKMKEKEIKAKRESAYFDRHPHE